MKELTDYELWRGTRMGNPVFIMGPVIHPQANQVIYPHVFLLTDFSRLFKLQSLRVCLQCNRLATFFRSLLVQ